MKVHRSQRPPAMPWAHEPQSTAPLELVALRRAALFASPLLVVMLVLVVWLAK